MHTDRGIETTRGIERFRGGFRPSHELDEGQQVDWIERMRHQEPLGRLHVALQIRRHQPRSARCDDDVGCRMAADVREDPLFELELLGDVFLNEVHLARHRVQVGRKGERALARQRRQGQPGERNFGVGDGTADPRLHFRLHVRRNDVDSEVHRPGRPAAPDHAGTQQPQCFDSPHRLHPG